MTVGVLVGVLVGVGVGVWVGVGVLVGVAVGVLVGVGVWVGVGVCVGVPSGVFVGVDVGGGGWGVGSLPCLASAFWFSSLNSSQGLNGMVGSNGKLLVRGASGFSSVSQSVLMGTEYTVHVLPVNLPSFSSCWYAPMRNAQ